MKKLLMTVAAFCALSVPAMAVELIGGGAMGYTFGGPATKQTVYTATAGTLTKTFNENAKLFTVARLKGNAEQENKWGAKAILATRITSLRWLWALLDISAMKGGFVNADGSEDFAIGFGGGVSASVNPNLSLVLYFEAMRVSGDDWDRTLWFAPTASVEF